MADISARHDETTEELDEFVEYSNGLGSRLKRVSEEFRAYKKVNAPALGQAADLMDLPASSKEVYEKKISHLDTRLRATLLLVESLKTQNKVVAPPLGAANLAVTEETTSTGSNKVDAPLNEAANPPIIPSKVSAPLTEAANLPVDGPISSAASTAANITGNAPSSKAATQLHTPPSGTPPSTNDSLTIASDAALPESFTGPQPQKPKTPPTTVTKTGAKRTVSLIKGGCGYLTPSLGN